MYFEGANPTATAALEQFAAELREWFDFRLEQERQTIEIQALKASDAKATRLAAHKLENLQAWNEAQESRKKLRKQRSEQCKSNLFWFGQWIGSGRSGIFFFICGVLISTTATAVAIINLPTFLSCPNSKSLCYQVYQMRFNNKSVILPGQAKDIVAEYERNKTKSKRRK
ncbi:hypothetical protein IQ277_35230 [Nostocales cyanobacterium LEGE 12452]|nr:hypothetical protein [Nostocales cyanobacterium LEGE 12452]